MSPNPPTSRQSGFSLIELLIGMLIAIEILVAALTVFDVHSRMARVQMQITDMQQSLRVAQYDMVRTTRMAGRGGLQPNFSVDNVTLTVPWLRGDAVEVRDNVATGDDQDVAIGTDEPKALAGTDILTVRGCISGLQFQMDETNRGGLHADRPGPAQARRPRARAGSRRVSRAGLERPDRLAELGRPQSVRGRRGRLRGGNRGPGHPHDDLRLADRKPHRATARESAVRAGFRLRARGVPLLRARHRRGRHRAAQAAPRPRAHGPGNGAALCRRCRQPDPRYRRRHLRPPGRARFRHRL